MGMKVRFTPPTGFRFPKRLNKRGTRKNQKGAFGQSHLQRIETYNKHQEMLVNIEAKDG